MRIFHVATRADWEEAVRRGAYTTSTRGRTLAEEGFIHAARADQWQDVRRRYYADVTEPLVLLVIESERLGAPVVEEEVPGGATFPHVYGVIEPDAVVQVLPLDAVPGPPGPPAPGVVAAPGAPPAPGPPPAGSFLQVLMREMVLNMVLVVLVVAVTGALGILGALVASPWGGPVGLALGLVLGVAAARALHRRRT